VPRRPTLPLGIRRTLFRSLALSLFRRGQSANYVIKVARDMGLGYMRKKMLADWREVTGIEKKKDVWRFVPKKYFPPKYLIEKTDHAIKTKYHYMFDVEMKEIETGIIKTFKRTVATDEWITIRKAEEELKSLVVEPVEDFYAEEYEVIRYRFVGIRENIKYRG